MHCCSKWFEQLSSRNAERFARRRFTSRHELLHSLWNEDHQSGCRLAAYRRLPATHSAISLRYYSELRHNGRASLHRGSRRERHKSVHTVVTFCVSRGRRKMYCGHARLCVCLSVCPWPYAHTTARTRMDVTWGRGRGCPLVVHYWADLQSVHRLRCYGNITQTLV